MANVNDKSSRFFALYTQVQGRLYSYLMMVVHNRNAADDLLQEISAIMWENFDKFEAGTNFGAWAVQIARNKCFEYIRENQKTRMLFKQEFYVDMADIAEQSSDHFTGHIRALEHCLTKLSKSDQKLMHLRYKSNMAVKELALRTGLSSSALYKKIVRIFSALRSCVTASLAVRRYE